MSFAERFQTVSRNRRRHHPVPEVSVGRRAELHVESMLAARLRHTAYDYFAGLRIPYRGGRREIDFVITAPDELWLVELKNWTGFVGLDDGGRVVQHRSGGRGVVDHGRLLRDMETKQRALERYLRRALDDVPRLWNVLVFYNRQVQLDERLATRDDLDVVRLPELLSALPEPSESRSGVFGFFRRLFGGDTDDEQQKLPAVSEPVRAAKEELASLGTWDLLALHGGQIISGDLVDASRDELGDRDRFDQLLVDVPRSYLDAFRQSLAVEVTAAGRTGGEETFEYGFDESIRFHCAGDPKPKEFGLRDLEALSFGYTS